MQPPTPSRSLLPALVLAALLAVVHLCTRPANTAAGAAGPAVTLELAQGLFPGAAELGPVLAGQPVAVLDATGQALGTLIDTTPFAAHHPGYGGPVPAVLGLATDGRIVGVRLLENAESPTFVEFVVEEGFLERWNGLSAAAAAVAPIDAVSGATMTSQAVLGSVRQALAALAAAPVQPPPTPARVAWTGRLVWAVLGLCLLSFLAGQRWRWLRVVARPASVVVLGFLAGLCLSLALVQGWLAHGLPWARQPALACLVAAAVLIPILSGRNIHCGQVCPYGQAQDLAGMLWRWRRPRLPRWLATSLPCGRGAVLVGVFLLLVARVSFDLTAVEPFAAFQWRSAPLAALGLAGAFLALSVVWPRLWCRHLCPTGYLLETCRGLRWPAAGATPWLSFERGALAAALAGGLILAWRSTSAAAPHQDPLPPVSPAAAETEPPPSAAVPDVLTAIHARHSVRHYTEAPVLPAQLDTLVRAAMAGPSAGNAQPWAFVVVTERARLQRLAASLDYGKMLAQAGAAIVVCGVPEKALPGAAAAFWVQDCSAAAENVLLAAQGIGLGAVWVGIYPLEERMAAVRRSCDIPAAVNPLCVISLGVTAGVEAPRDKYDSGNVHWERW